MAGPWEKYAAKPAGGKPWEKYQSASLPSRAADPVTPDGRATAPGTTSEQAADIPEGMIYDPETGGYADAAAIAAQRGEAKGRLGNFIAGVPFIGEGIDEAVGAIGGPVAGETARQSIKQYQEAHPFDAAASRMAGGVIASAPAAAVAGPLAAIPGAIGKTAAAVVGGAVAGGAEGAASGYLRGTDPESRASGAARGAALGAGTGAVAGGAGLALGAIGKELMERVKRADLRVISDELGISPRAAALVKRYLVNDDLGAAQKALIRAGDEAMLADAGPGTAAALDAAAQTGGAPLRIARDAVNARANAAQPKIVSLLDRVLGAPDGRKAATKAINQRTAKAREAAFDAAFSKPINYADGSGRAVESVLGRIAPDTMRAAIKEANDQMRDEGVRNLQIMAQIADDGTVSFAQMPDVRQLHALKRALDDIANKGRDSITGQMTGEAARAAGQAKALRDAVKAAVPEYGTALKLGGDTIAEREALDMGARLLDAKTTVEDVRAAMAGATDAQKAAIRQGLRQSIDKRMGDVRGILTEDGTAAREAVKATLDVSSRNAKAKLAIALGSDAKAIMRGLDESSAALELKAAMAGNSKTAIRTAGREAIDEVVSPNAVESLLMADVGKATRKAVSAATGMTGVPSERREAVLAEVARALVNTRGPDARRALVTVRKAMAGQPASDAQAKEVGKLVGSAGFIGAYQALSQPQGR